MSGVQAKDVKISINRDFASFPWQIKIGKYACWFVDTWDDMLAIRDGITAEIERIKDEHRRGYENMR